MFQFGLNYKPKELLYMNQSLEDKPSSPKLIFCNQQT